MESAPSDRPVAPNLPSPPEAGQSCHYREHQGAKKRIDGLEDQRFGNVPQGEQSGVRQIRRCGATRKHALHDRQQTRSKEELLRNGTGRSEQEYQQGGEANISAGQDGAGKGKGNESKGEDAFHGDATHDQIAVTGRITGMAEEQDCSGTWQEVDEGCQYLGDWESVKQRVKKPEQEYADKHRRACRRMPTFNSRRFSVQMVAYPRTVLTTGTLRSMYATR